MAASAIDLVDPAFKRMVKLLFSSFRFSQWLRLAVVGFLAGEMGSGGFNSSFPMDFGNGPVQPWPPVLEQAWPLLVAGIALLIVLSLALGVVFLYINSRMRFVLFDSIVNGECRIRESWRRRGGPAFRYFVWQFGFTLVTLVTVSVLVGLPVLAAYLLGWFESPRDHIAALIAGGIGLFLLLVLLFVIVGATYVLTKDFVVPQMALEDIKAMEGWRRLWAMMKSEKGRYAEYVVMKILLSIGAAIVLSIIGIIILLIVAIPVGGFGLVAVLGGEAAGLTWNPLTIVIAIVIGGLALLLLILAMALISVPAIVFFPTYALTFFAGRYPPLYPLMYPSGPPVLSPLN